MAYANRGLRSVSLLVLLLAALPATGCRRTTTGTAKTPTVTTRPVASMPAAEQSGMDVPDSGGRTPLHRAAAAGDVDAVEQLLAHGCRRDLRDNGGATAKDLAARSGHTVIEDILSYPECHVTVPGAYNIHRMPGVNDSKHCIFFVRDPYPAKDVMDVIVDRLARLGWTPTPYDIPNPTIPGSLTTGWEDFIVVGTGGYPDVHRHQWVQDWLDSHGNHVRISLKYQYPRGATPDLTTLRVDEAWFPKSHSAPGAPPAGAEDE